jgi:beta-fructofuranosidase
MKLNGEYSAEILNGRKLDLTVKVRPSEDKVYDNFEVRFFQKDNNYAFVKYNTHESMVTLSREFTGVRRAIVNKTSCSVDNKGGEIELRIILDKYSAEVFINGGKYAMTIDVYNDQSFDGISFVSDGEALIDIEKYSLEK